MEISPYADMSVHSHYIQTDEQLTPFLPALESKPVFAVDTEFVRERTLTAQFGLLQLFDGENLLLIEPDVALASPSIWQMLENPKQLKLLHAANEDLELFFNVNGTIIKNIVDTQLAAAFLGMGNALGFGALVEKQLAVSLDKSHARTDWLKRPLSEQQLRYAADDVRYLLPLYNTLEGELIEKGLMRFCMAESQRIADSKCAPDRELAYLGVKNSWQLNARELALLKLLAAWRLDVAQQKDLALSFVVNDHALIEIAKRCPETMEQLRAIVELRPHEYRRYGKHFLRLISLAKTVPEEEFPGKIMRIVDLSGYKSKQKQMAKRVEEVASNHGMPAAVLASKKQIGQFLIWQSRVENGEQSDTLPVLAQSWRNELLELV